MLLNGIHDVVSTLVEDHRVEFYISWWMKWYMHGLEFKVVEISLLEGNANQSVLIIVNFPSVLKEDGRTFVMCPLRFKLDSKITSKFLTHGPGLIHSVPIYKGSKLRFKRKAESEDNKLSVGLIIHLSIRTPSHGPISLIHASSLSLHLVINLSNFSVKMRYSCMSLA